MRAKMRPLMNSVTATFPYDGIVAIIEDSDDDEGEIEVGSKVEFKVKGMEATQEGVILRLDDEKEIASIKSDKTTMDVLYDDIVSILE